MNYRSDLDGLRCIAVFIVMLFHARIPYFEGGFIGVDLFIVISGYLISGVIINNIISGVFSFKNFYLKRIKRIIPALFLMIILLALFYLLTEQSYFERETLIESIFSAIFMFTNFIAWKHVGYFAQGIELMPLIHTWSLSLEEQFYLVFPIFVFITFRNKNVNNFILLVFILTLLSFFLTFYGSKHHSNFNFFMLPTRAWEFGIGIIIQLIQSKGLEKHIFNYHKKLLYYLGGNLILFSLFIFRNSIEHPSYWTLFPVLGIGLLILFPTNSLLYNILTNRVAVHFGLISYSLYLYHQPFLVILRSFSYHPEYVSKLLIFPTFLITYIFSFFSYKLIEKNFRNNFSFKVLCFFIIGSTIFFLFFYYYYSNKKEDFYSYVIRDLERENYGCSELTEIGCLFGKDSDQLDAILIGNSHAKMLIPNLSESFSRAGLKGFYPRTILPNNALAINENTMNEDVRKFLDQVCSFAEKTRFLIISQRFTPKGKKNYFYDQSSTTDESIKFSINSYKERILQLSDCFSNVIVIGPVPETASWGPNLRRSFIGQKISSTLTFYHSEHNLTLALLNDLSNKEKIKVIDPSKFLCDQYSCFDQFLIDGEKIPLYYDDNHLNRLGSAELVDHLVDVLKLLINESN